VPLSPEGTLLDGRYRVLRHLGSGGMASVLLCHDERLGRQVAVKRLHADSPADVEQRFVREARLGALLNHPNIVTVYDTATDSDGVLIVMEYVAGEALSLTLKRGPLRSERVGLMVRDLGAALDHLHGHGVVHRDVKPGNVLLRKDGVTKLVDLGIATASDQTRITRSGMVLGTASYMAPEQLEGGEAGPPTDIYALSVVTYEALTGQRARSGRTPMEIAHRMATEPPPDLRERLPDAPPAAARLLQQGMARDPDERPRSAGELSTRLARALEEPATEPIRTEPRAATVPVKPPPPRPSPPHASPPGRRKAGAIALAVVLLALVAAVAIGVILSGGDDGNGSGEASQAEQGQAKKEEKKKKRDKSKKQKESTAAVDPARGAELNDQGFALMQQGDFAGAVPLLEQAVASYPEDSQDIGYAYALFNLGKSLNRSGHPDEAIPVLERRLVFPDQRETVQRELDLARAGAG
jgi:eukaryotic-like serine/threonine-protein kinase